MRGVHQHMGPETLDGQDLLHLAQPGAVVQVVHTAEGLLRALIAVHAADAEAFGQAVQAAGGQEAHDADEAAANTGATQEPLPKGELVPEGLGGEPLEPLEPSFRARYG